jgi:hypothetical protein
MISTKNLKTQLDKFNGDDHYYYNPLFPTMKYTPGVKYLADVAGCHWLLADIAILYLPKQMNEEWSGFLVIKVTVIEDSANITVEDGNKNALHTKWIPYTDMPEGEWVLWLIDGVLILPGEY